MAQCTYCKGEIQLYDGGTAICVKCSEDRESKREPRAPTQDIKSALNREVAAATQRVLSATEAFSVMLVDIPSRLPHPDGTQRIRSASNQLKIARKDMARAHSRF